MDDARSTAVRGYAGEVVACPPDRVTAVRRFEDGNRHDVYRVTHLDGHDREGHVVVRVSLADDADERDQAEREARVLEQMGGRDRAAPELLDFRVTSEWFTTPTMCMQFVGGRHQELGSADPGDVDALGSVVAWVHAQPVGGLVPTLGPATDVGAYAEDRLRSILATLEWVRDPLPAAVQARLLGVADGLRDRWSTTRDAPSFTAGGTLVTLHGDIGPGNVLWGPEPVLIDWEYTRLGDPADEIAYLFDQNGLGRSRRDAFWHGYGVGSGGAAVVDRVQWWEPLTLLGSALWWVQRWIRRTAADAAGTVDPEAHREPSYYLDHVTRRLDRLDALSP